MSSPAVGGISRTPIGIQLAHAGRKASAAARRGRAAARSDPTASHGPRWRRLPCRSMPAGTRLSSSPRPGSSGIVDAFVTATRRAQRIGLDEVELHCAHGYLLHEFLSPIANQPHGRLWRQPREPHAPAAARCRRHARGVARGQADGRAYLQLADWVDGGWTIDDSVVFARALKEQGCDFVCASSGGIAGGISVPATPGYQVGFAERIRREAGIATRAVGFITTPQQAETVIASGQADMIALARAMLDDPRWGWHAGDALGASAPYPPQYARARPTPRP